MLTFLIFFGFFDAVNATTPASRSLELTMDHSRSLEISTDPDGRSIELSLS